MDRLTNMPSAVSKQGSRSDIVVIAIGQALRGDDGAGVEAVRFWQQKYPQSAASVRIEVMESPGLELLEEVKGVRAAIMVDALQASAPTGSIVRLGVEDLESFSSPEKSAHGWGLAETLKLGFAILPWLGQVNIVLLGIVGKKFKLGVGINPGIRAALGVIADRIETELQLIRLHSLEKNPHLYLTAD